jgi:uncharacterized hydrophobic protein (TIGR00271 family)
MLHIRVLSPAEVTGRLTEYLTAESGVVGLVVLPAADPAGTDSVQFDVTPDSANRVLRRLRHASQGRRSAVMVETVDAAISGAPRRPRLPAWPPSFRDERAPVWDLVEARISDDANYPPSFFGLLVFAAIIGACGILTNSQILIVGAMVVGPEYAAIVSVALGIQRRDWATAGRGLLVLLVGFLLAIVVTLVFALCIRALGRAPRLYLDGIRPVSDLINSPDLFSVVVAVVAGLVGVVSLTLARGTALIGVFISITTIPAAADIAVSMAFSSWGEAAGSAEQLLLNVGLLVVVGAVGFRVQHLIWRR